MVAVRQFSVLSERPVEIQRGAKGALTFVFGDGFKAEPYSARAKPAPSKAKTKAAAMLTIELPRDPVARLALVQALAPTPALRSLHGRRAGIGMA